MMQQLARTSRVAGCLLAVLAALSVHAAQGSAAPEPLDRDGIIDLVSDRTTQCRKEKDQSLCDNYFSDDGAIKRLNADGSRRQGVWFIDDSERLCILWQGRIKPLCFLVFPQADGSYHLIKNGRHVSSILGTEPGNTRHQ